MKSVLKPFPSRRLSKTKFFYWEPTAANKPTIYLATESRSWREVGREEVLGEWEGRREGGSQGRACFLPPVLYISERMQSSLPRKVVQSGL